MSAIHDNGVNDWNSKTLKERVNLAFLFRELVFSYPFCSSKQFFCRWPRFQSNKQESGVDS